MDEVWKQKYIPIHDLFQSIPGNVLHSILQFHGITGCDTTSFISGHTKPTAWKVFLDNPELCSCFGEVLLTDDTLNKSEQFYCKLYIYSVPDNIISVDVARVVMFAKSKTPKKPLPTSDALQLHINRASLPSLENVKYSNPCFAKSIETRPEI